MATIFSDGFESNDFSAWTGTGGSPSIQSSVVHCGSYAMLSAYSGAGSILAYKTFDAVTEVHLRAYFKLSALPGQDVYSALCGLLGASDGRGVSIGIKGHAGPTYSLYYYMVNGAEGGESFSFAVDTWYCLEVGYVVHASTGSLEVRVDDVVVVDYLGDTDGQGNINGVRVNCDAYRGFNHAANVYCDCVVVSDSYIGPETSIPVFMHHYTKNVWR